MFCFQNSDLQNLGYQVYSGRMCKLYVAVDLEKTR